MSDDNVLLEAGAAAEVVRVSSSGLRRIAPIYESVHGALPRKPKSNNRLWPQEALERLQAARQLIDRGRYRTISEALIALQRGLDVDEVEMVAETLQTASEVSTQQALSMLIDEVRRLRQEMTDMRASQLLQNKNTTAREELKVLSQHGIFVRAALRLETWLKRFK